MNKNALNRVKFTLPLHADGLIPFWLSRTHTLSRRERYGRRRSDTRCGCRSCHGGGVVQLSGLAAWRVLGEFALDPLTCLDRQARRLGSHAIRIDAPRPWGRQGDHRVLILIGARYNRQVLMATDRLRPTGVWPVRGPEGSDQHALIPTALIPN